MAIGSGGDGLAAMDFGGVEVAALGIEFWMGAAAFALACLALGLGWRGERLAEARAAREPGLPPPLPAGKARWWRVPGGFYNGFDLPLMGFVVLVYTLPLWLEAAGMLAEPAAEIGWQEIAGTIVMQLFLATLVTGFVAWRCHPVRWLGLRWRSWPWVLLIAPLALGLMQAAFVALQLSGFIEWLQGQLGDDGLQPAVEAFQSVEDPWLVAGLAFTAVVVAPLTEELLFRGYVYPVARWIGGRVPAILFSSLIFALAHHNAVAMVPLLLLAVVLVLAYEWTGSIWAPVAIHMLFNGTTVVVQLMIRAGWVEMPAT